MNIGDFNRKVDIYEYQEVEDEIGATETRLVKLYSTWSRIQAVRGREYYEAQRIKEADLYRIYIRYRKNIDNTMIIKYKDVDYQIQRINDIDMAHEFLELTCIVKIRGKQ